MDEQELRREAKAHVSELKGFYVHLLVYILVNAGLVILNIILHQNWWIWVVFGWGIGLLSHAISLFAHRMLFSRKWEEGQIRKYMDENR